MCECVCLSVERERCSVVYMYKWEGSERVLVTGAPAKSLLSGIGQLTKFLSFTPNWEAAQIVPPVTERAQRPR